MLRFRPGSQDDLAPAGEGRKAAANLAALVLLRDLQNTGRAAGPAEAAVLARWSGWGAVPRVFDHAAEGHAHVRAQLRGLLDEGEWNAAARTTLNAHYTDAALATAMWRSVLAAGLAERLAAGDPVTVLEPGCGAGTFLGLAPLQVSALIGIELDPTTAAIAAHLYPHADIRAESFADTRLPEGSVDLVIGNVPFAKTVLHDRVHNSARHALHNYFILKSLALTRPGGVVAVLTSHWTMDAVNPAARRDIAAVGDLVTAVRLPRTAHQRAAGTEVITDVLLLRRRHPARTTDQSTTGPLGWDTVVRIGGDDTDPVSVNRYFLDHPDQVLGVTGTRSGPHGEQLSVTAPPGTDTPAVAVLLEQQLTRGIHAYQQAPAPLLTAAGAGVEPGRLFPPRPAASAAGTTGPGPVFAPPTHLQGHIDVASDRDGGDGFTVVDAGSITAHPVPASQARELRALLGLRNTTMALLAAEAATAADTDHITRLRRTLNRQYDAYTQAFGPINRVTFRRTGRVDETTGEDKLARISPPQGRFRDDPHSPAVYALEDYDAATGTARRAQIMTERVIAPRAHRHGADTPADALAVCLDTHADVRLDVIAHLLGRTPDDTREALRGLVFADPQQQPQDGGAAAGVVASSGAHADPREDPHVPPTPKGPGPEQGPEQAPPAQSAEVLVPAAEYLSGNVRAKLAAAEAAAERDGGTRWAANIAALQAVVPTDLTPAEIDVALGASWIGADTVQQFLRDVLQDHKIVVEHPGGSTWAVRGDHTSNHTVLATSTYGTARASAIGIVADMLQQRPVKVTDELDDGRRVTNLTETLAAQDKAREITEAFTDWIWTDPERANTLAERYNLTFNAIVLRSYDGAQMQLPGLAVGFTPRTHQVAAVARIVAEPAVLLAHEVGAGKTAEMVIGMVELRRLGLARKPAIVVPNHMLEQFTREFVQLYPQAKVLAAGIDDLGAQRRRRMVARIATGDWDSVILSRSAFERLALSPAAQAAYLDRQLTEMRAQLTAAKGSPSRMTVKRLEGSLARAEERIKRLTDTAKDPGVTFEETGVDYLCVDEAHGYKNLRTESNIPNIAIEGSARATDLDMKLDWLRSRHGRRVLTLATATPIANTVSEAYTMQRYCRPDLLVDAGLTDFDTWAATFGEVVTDLELAPDGSRFRMQSRFAKFRNVPELLRLWHVSADIKTAEDLDLPTPALAGGAAQTVVVPATDELTAFMRELAYRADLVQSRSVLPTEDNMLRIASHGRAAALDLRLLPDGYDRPDRPADDLGPDELDPDQLDVDDVDLDLAVDDGAGKLTYAANRIAAIHHAHAEDTYPGSDVPGALQIVFCDLGTPSARTSTTGAGGSGGSGGGAEPRWSAYDEVKRLLVERGIPAGRIRYVHEARNDKEKGEMFAAARNGRINVLLGSTEKMGVGTNVQARAIALHHLDCPWRPADLAQREGRIMRQGNHNPEVQILRYVTEGSFDAYLWQTCERKAKFIGQVMRGRLDVREIEDVGDTALSYSEVKALATGDPRILDKARSDAEVTKLERLERAHTRDQRLLSAAVETLQQKLPQLATELTAIEAAIPLAVPTSGDRFAMTVGGVHAGSRTSNRADAAIALSGLLRTLRPGQPGTETPQQVGTLGGFGLTAVVRSPRTEPYLLLEFDGVPRSTLRVHYEELRDSRPLGIILKLENRVADLPDSRTRVLTERDRAAAELARARDSIGQAFPHQQALDEARKSSMRLAEELAAREQQLTQAREAAHVAPQTAGRDPAPNTKPTGHPTGGALVAPASGAVPAARWRALADTVDRRLTRDQHWPDLVDRFDRIATDGGDVAQVLRELTREPLPLEHPGLELHHRITQAGNARTRAAREARPAAPAHGLTPGRTGAVAPPEAATRPDRGPAPPGPSRGR